MKKILISFIFVFLLFVINTAKAQQVKISDDADATINSNAILELKSTNKGFLPPRVALTDLSATTPLAGASVGMLVYSTGGSVTDGFYYWNGTNWTPITATPSGVTIVSKTATAVLTVDETFVLASALGGATDITLTLPEITPAEDGLVITIKNVGDYTDQVNVIGYSGATIDQLDTVKLYRWKVGTFIASNGEWFRKEKDTQADNIFDVSASGSWTTLSEVLAFLAVNKHMLSPSVIRLDGGYYDIVATQTINLPHALTIQGPSYGQAIVEPDGSIPQNAPLFICQSEVSFKMIAFDAANKSGYGSHIGENAINLVTQYQYHEIKDCTFDGFYDAIHISEDVDIWLFECDISGSTNSGVEIAANGAVSFYTSESDFEDCGKAINLNSANGATVSVQNCTFTCSTGQTGLVYNPGGFLNMSSLFFTNNTWNRVGDAFISGFDFTLSNGRDANVEIINNAGIEDKNPKVQVSIIDDNNSQNLSAPNTQWYTPSWTVDNSVIVNWAVSGNQITYLPSNPRDVFITVSGNVEASSVGTVTIAIEKTNQLGTITTRYGATTLRFVTQTTTVPTAFSTLVYLQNVAKGDYFRLVFQASPTSGTVKFQDVNIFANAQ